MANQSLNSMLQVAIDHHLLHSKIKLFLSGSHVSFMEKKVMGEKSPLFGRRTAAIQLKPFDYYETGLMLSRYDNVDKMRFFSVLGGVPYYLSLVNQNRTFEENVIDLFFKLDGKLYDEPNFLMREEFNDATIYNSVIMAIAKGANRPHQIQQITKLEANVTPFYLRQLTDIGFLRKRIPFGENPLKSRKGVYEIADNTFRFWYMHVYPYATAIELGAGEAVARQNVLPLIDDFIGKTVFEDVALDYLVRLVKKGKLTVMPLAVGKWWGNDPEEKKHTDIDVVFSDNQTVIIGECKWRESFDEVFEINKLLEKERLLPGYKTYQFYFFSKKDLGSSSVERVSKIDNFISVTLDDMYK
jgi:AAA+ ATPase superfamily predicted ATPase